MTPSSMTGTWHSKGHPILGDLQVDVHQDLSITGYGTTGCILESLPGADSPAMGLINTEMKLSDCGGINGTINGYILLSHDGADNPVLELVWFSGGERPVYLVFSSG